MKSASRIVIAFLSLSSAASAVFAQKENPSLDREVDQIFSAYDRPDSPGCSVGVIRDGNYIFKKSYGSASLELGVPLSSQSVFYMASVSKQFTAASTVLAAEQGYFSLDDDIRKFIPELPAYGHPVTIRQMLHHTSGFRDVLGLLDLAGRNFEDVHTTAEMLDLLSRQKSLNFDPGEEYSYSNTNFFLMSVLIQRTTKKSLAQFAEENIFKPLGMTHTHFHDDRTAVSRNRASAYAPREGGGFSIDWSLNFDKVGDGGLLSSIDDLLLWDRNFYGNKLGKGSLLQELQTRGRLNSGKDIQYALGLEMTDYRGLPVVAHGGAMFGYRTNLIRFPQQKFSVITLCNVAGARPGELDNKIADLYLAGQFPEDAAQAAKGDGQSPSGSSAPPDDPTPFLGTYRNPASHSLLEVSAKEGELVVYGQHLKSRGQGRFTFAFGGELQFQTPAVTPPRFTLAFPDSPAEHYEKVEPLHPAAEALAEYAGNFTSEELEVTYRIATRDGKLTLAMSWREPDPLTPSFTDEFQGPDGTSLVFRRDAAKHIAGFDLYAGRVRKITFTRNK
ncbi:MAG TPA: serine hydrolase domain-containing protein [Candidatus Saccharimonadales bacterium]|nr:serine hydrolase domain-containing protein [Candidatus Saccharimonadales bacterium]